MDERGVLKVMDFGLAKVVAGEPGHTLRGVAVGTPHYMSPEQLMGGTLDARSDLYAAGIVLYECLTGRTPFSADSPIALVSQMIDGQYPPPADTGVDAPPALVAIVAHLLQLQPDDRIASAADLSARLAAIDFAGTPGDPA
jgi:serine/threonine protein kinase